MNNKRKKISMSKMLGYGAAATGGLFACSQADADVVNSGAGNGFTLLDTGAGAVGSVDIDGNGVNDILFYNIFPGTQFAMNDNNLYAGGGALMGGTTNGFYFPSQLGASTVIGTGGQNFVSLVGWQGYQSAGGSVSTDPWGVFANGVATGYLGFQFYGTTAGAGFGLMNAWFQIRLTEGIGGVGSTYEVLDWAYENMGNPIHAGDRGFVVPEPSTATGLALASLAVGAAGLRRRRKAKAA